MIQILPYNTLLLVSIYERISTCPCYRLYSQLGGGVSAMAPSVKTNYQLIRNQYLTVPKGQTGTNVINQYTHP